MRTHRTSDRTLGDQSLLAVVALVGLTSTATRAAAGSRSRKSPRRFATTSAVKKLIPVALPPGRARLATRPSLTFGDAENDRDRPGCGFSRQRRHRAPWRRNHTHLPMHQVSHLLGEPVEAPFRQAILDG